MKFLNFLSAGVTYVTINKVNSQKLIWNQNPNFSLNTLIEDTPAGAQQHLSWWPKLRKIPFHYKNADEENFLEMLILEL